MYEESLIRPMTEQDKYDLCIRYQEEPIMNEYELRYGGTELDDDFASHQPIHRPSIKVGKYSRRNMSGFADGKGVQRADMYLRGKAKKKRMQKDPISMEEIKD